MKTKKNNMVVFGLIATLAVLSSRTLKADTVYVNRNAPDCDHGNTGHREECGVAGGPFKTLLRAVRAADENDTLQLKSATYDSCARIGKKITLRASDGPVRLSKSESEPWARGRRSGADLDGDGIDDLVSSNFGGVARKVGRVDVRFGSIILFGEGGGHGLTDEPQKVFQRNDPQSYSGFGTATAHGDFNGDGFDDIAIGIPAQDVGGETDAGAVEVVFGFQSFHPEGAQRHFLTRDSNKTGDRFGSALAVGNLNGDQFADLVIGIPGRDLGPTRTDMGGISICLGSADGLVYADTPLWLQPTEAGAMVGASLICGDFSGNDIDEIAAGAPGTGAVLVGSFLTNAFVKTFRSREDPNFYRPEPWEDEDYGAALAAGDFNDDGFVDLAVGIPRKDYELERESGYRTPDAGQVELIYFGPAVERKLVYKPGINEVFSYSEAWAASHGFDKEDYHYAESYAEFGATLATGDFNNDGIVDLAIGAPNHQATRLVSGDGSDSGIIQTRHNVGEVFIVSGGRETESEPQPLNNIDYEPGLSGDRFGFALAVGDFEGDGKDDLAVREPGIGGGLDGEPAEKIYYAIRSVQPQSNQEAARLDRRLNLDSYENGLLRDPDGESYQLNADGEVRSTTSGSLEGFVPAYYFGAEHLLVNADYDPHKSLALPEETFWRHVLGGSARHEPDRKRGWTGHDPTPAPTGPGPCSSSLITSTFTAAALGEMNALIDMVLADFVPDLFPGYSGTVTVAVGSSAGVAAGISLGGEVGLWRTSTGDQGVFAAYSYGIALDLSVGVGHRVTVIKGDKHKLAGNSIGASVAAGIRGTPAGAEFTIIQALNVNTGYLEDVGFSFGSSIGAGLPIGVGLERSHTEIHTDQTGWYSGSVNTPNELTCEGNVFWMETWTGDKFILWSDCE